MERLPLKYVVPIFVVASLCTVSFYTYLKIEKEIKEAKVELAFEIIKFHLVSLSDEKMKQSVKQWAGESRSWGAQIGAIRTVCHNDPDKIAELMYKKDIVYLCRLVN